MMGILLALAGFGLIAYSGYMSGLTGYWNPMYFIWSMVLCGIGGVIMMLGKKK